MVGASDFRTKRMPLTHGAGHMPVLAVRRGAALLTTPKTAARARENFNISALPEDEFDKINRIQTRQRFNEAVKTGSPGFIPRGK
jgi:alcohol dehydrogenase (NADP+)